MSASHCSKMVFRCLALLLSLTMVLGLTACDLPQVRAEDRIFLNLKLEFLGEYQLPNRDFQETKVGGLSGITYDRLRDRFYAVSDDRSQFSPARFYTLKLDLNLAQSSPRLQRVTIEQVTPLKSPQGETYPLSSLDPEGIALTKANTVFVSSEGVAGQTAPFVDEFDLQTGNWKLALPLPPYFLAKPQPSSPQANSAAVASASPQGVGNNLGFESLTIVPSGDRLFTAAESNLLQDVDPAYTGPVRARILHYLLGEPRPQLVSEHLYELEPAPEGATFHGLVELLAVDNAGHFLSLERTFSPNKGIAAKLFQIATGAATDVSGSAVLKGKLTGIQPVRKQFLLDFNQLGLSLDNLEGMTFGPRLPDGSQTLLVVADNNFQTPNTQFLLFRCQQGPQYRG
jgi:hypothetical protein